MRHFSGRDLWRGLSSLRNSREIRRNQTEHAGWKASATYYARVSESEKLEFFLLTLIFGLV
jgi:hypothetical protein